MLKIKNNVNLKELEKFGFVNNGCAYEYVLPNPDNKEDKQMYVIIYVKDWFKYKVRYLYIYVDEFIEGDNIYSIDILFDLITAGLVEKVME